MEFGLPVGISVTNLFGFPETTAVATIDNLSVTVSSVPEPEAYAMLLAGLGLVGFMARRTRQALTKSSLKFSRLPNPPSRGGYARHRAKPGMGGGRDAEVGRCI